MSGGTPVEFQSVSDFSVRAGFLTAALRKENRKPASTPPAAKSFSRTFSLKGSKSANNAGEKRGGGRVLMARKSYAAVYELRNLSSAVGNAVAGESRGGGRKTVLGCRKLGI